MKPEGITEAQLVNANIGKDYWECDFNNFLGPKEVKNLTKSYLYSLEKMQSNGIGILYAGPNGVGKTTLAAITIKYLLRANWSCYMITLSEFIEGIKRSWEFKDMDRYEDICRDVDFLLIDDVGKEYKGASDFVKMTFDNMIRHRVQNRKPTIMTTNLKRNELESRYGEALLSMIEGKCRVVTVNGEDARKTILKPELERLL